MHYASKNKKKVTIVSLHQHIEGRNWNKISDRMSCDTILQTCTTWGFQSDDGFWSDGSVTTL